MKTIENIKTGKKYPVTEAEYSRIMKNPLMRAKYITHKSAEVPDEVKKEMEKRESLPQAKRQDSKKDNSKDQDKKEETK